MARVFSPRTPQPAATERQRWWPLAVGGSREAASPPLLAAETARLPAPDALPRELTDTEIADLLCAPSDDGRLILTGLLSGLSAEEIIALAWDQIDLDAGTIRVSGESPRTLPLSDSAPPADCRTPCVAAAGGRHAVARLVGRSTIAQRSPQPCHVRSLRRRPRRLPAAPAIGADRPGPARFAGSGWMRIGRTRLIAALSLGLFAWALAADAQQPTKIPRVAVLSDETPALAAKFFEPFAQGLSDLGWIEGQNVTIERRYAEGDNKLLPYLATELVSLQPDVIVAVGTPAARAAKTATETIPIVFARIADPVGSGLVTALVRPGGNLTGLTSQSRELAAKRLELLIAAVASAKRVGVLWDPNFPPDRPQLTEIERAAPVLNLQLLLAEVRGPDDFETALRAMAEQRADALIVLPGEVFDANSQQIADLTAKARLPTMFQRRELVEAGGLMSYGPDYPDMYRRAAAYVDKILKGAKPADLPVEQPTKLELVINLKTAKALGLTMPYTLLGCADEVIE